MKVTYHMPEDMIICVTFDNNFKRTYRNIKFADILNTVEREMRGHFFQTAVVIDDNTKRLIMSVKKDE